MNFPLLKKTVAAQEMQSGNIWGIRAVVDRLPIVIVSLIYYLVAARRDDQISSLFDHATIQYTALIVVISILTNCALALLVQRGNLVWKIADGLLFTLPLIFLVYAFHEFDRAVTYVACFGVILSVGAVVLTQQGSSATWRISLALFALTVLLWFVLFTTIQVSPLLFPREFGCVGLTLTFVGFVAIYLQLSLRYPAIGVPTLVLIGLLFVFQERSHHIKQVDITNHNANEEERESKIGRDSVSLQEAFNVWLSSRNDLKAYRDAGKPYPVFLVSSEGGGGYAAAHAEIFLSKLQKRCPNFAQHTFALVGVSGGAVGNSMFWAGLSDEVNLSEPQGCTDEAELPSAVKLLAVDNLSPVLAALYFNDFANKILPIFGGSDRADALRSSIVDSIGGSPDKTNPLYWLHYWDEDANGAWTMKEKPAVIDVATNLVSGKRYVFAPFAFSFPKARFEEGLRDLNWSGPDDKGPRASDISFMDAAIASASFPYITPSRVVSGLLFAELALVDGGYIDNSGAETARDILAELQQPNIYFDGATIVSPKPPKSYKGGNSTPSCEESPQYEAVANVEPPPADPVETCGLKFNVHVIAIRAQVPFERSVTDQNFFLDPITSILNSRSRRGETARYALLSQLCGHYSCAPQVDEASIWGLHESVIKTDDLTLPLGWALPQEAIFRLESVVAPKSTDEGQPDTFQEIEGMAAQDADQDSPFSKMSRNPGSMVSIQDTLVDPRQVIH